MTSQATLKTEIQTEGKNTHQYYANILERDKKGQGGKGGWGEGKPGEKIRKMEGKKSAMGKG